jgi:hypothetical protein
MPIYLGNIEINTEYVDSYQLGNIYVGPNLIQQGSVPIITTNLYGQFDATNSSSYTFGSTVWTNLLANGNIDLIGGVTYSPTLGGNLFFSGGAYGTGSLSGFTTLNPTPITIQSWFNMSGTDFAPAVQVGSGSNSGNAIGHGIKANSNVVTYFDNNAAGSAASNTTNVWINVASTVNTSGIAKTYFNGEFLYTVGGTNRISKPDILLGSGIGFSGSISQILIYNTVLSDAQIKQNYQATSLRYK